MEIAYRFKMCVATGPELSIIIVNWNSAGYLRACLSSIRNETQGLKYEVIVVDNDSTEDLGCITTDFDFVRLIRNHANLGFARANNIGFRNSGSPYILFLNPDTLIQGSALPNMVRVLKEQRDAGIVGCRLLNSDLTLQTSCIQRYPRLLNQALGADLLYRYFPGLPIWGLAPLSYRGDKPHEVEVVSGACLMIRREVLELAGLFSEEYFMYAEDVDLCHKVRQAAWRSYYVGNAAVIHHGGGSSRLRPVSNWAAVVQCGAKLHFLRKTRGKGYGILYRLAMAASAALRWLLLVSTARHGPPEATKKWAAIFRWTLRPDTTLQELTTTLRK